jgi:hypothetical protein
MLFTLIAEVRRYLGAPRRIEAQLQHAHATTHLIQRHLHRMETAMTDAASQIDALSTKVDAIAADVAVLVNADTSSLPADAQAALDRLAGKLTDLQGEVGDRDGSDTPAEPAPGDEDTQNL